MWKRRNRQRSQTASAAAAAAAAAAPTPAPPPPPSLPLDVSPAEQYPSSQAQVPLRAPSLAEPRVSPLQMTFDFELTEPLPKSQSSQRQSARPKTSDGVAAGGVNKRGATSLVPPTLPSIPRIASKEDDLNSAGLHDHKDNPSLEARDDSDNVSRLSKSARKPWLNFFNRSNESLPVLKPQTSAGGLSAKQDTQSSSRPPTSGSTSTARMDSSKLSKDSPVSGSQLIGAPPNMDATVVPKTAPLQISHNRSSSGLSVNKSFMENRENLNSNKPFTRRPANIQTGSEMLNTTPASNIYASPIALPSPNMLSVPSPMSINFNSTLREKRTTRMSTASGASLRAPSISGMRLSPASSGNSVAPKSPTYSGGHLSPSNSSFGPTSFNTGRKSISGARLSPQSSFDTLQKEPSPDRSSTIRKSWVTSEWKFEDEEESIQPPPIPESFRENFGPPESLVGATFNSKTPISTEPAPFELQRAQTNASSKSVKLPPHPSVYYEPKTTSGKPQPRRASRPHLLSTKSSPDLPGAASPTPSPSDISSATAIPSTKMAPTPSKATSTRSRRLTIGKPYAETSDAFPMPQRVSVRPQTGGNISTIGGTLVPTHYTSSSLQPEKSRAKQAKSMKGKDKLEKVETTKEEKGKFEKGQVKQANLVAEEEQQARQEKLNVENTKMAKEKLETPKQDKVERRKTRLLNPMALLSRKRNGGPPEIAIKPSTEEKSEQARAFARQKSVAAIGVEKLPANYDPRIKGKVVHDFSTPSRSSTRNFSYNEQDWEAEKSLSSYAPPASASVTAPALQNNTPSNGENARRSVHSPHFREMLDDDSDGDQINALQAEKLENKEFLQRASRQSTATTLSQESAVLPPFARRSQQLQLEVSSANFANETDSKRSSNPSTVDHSVDRNSALSALSMVSPMTQRSSNLLADARNSGSPISQRSPSNKSKQHSSSEVSQTRPTSPGSHMHTQPSNFSPLVEHLPADVFP
nr:hypothetical protein CFP56_64628 [Quercus suber]